MHSSGDLQRAGDAADRAADGPAALAHAVQGVVRRRALRAPEAGRHAQARLARAGRALDRQAALLVLAFADLPGARRRRPHDARPPTAPRQHLLRRQGVQIGLQTRLNKAAHTSARVRSKRALYVLCMQFFDAWRLQASLFSTKKPDI